MLRIIWCGWILIILNNSTLQCQAYPATSTEATTHIVSYIKQHKIHKQHKEKENKHNEFKEFDFENFRSNHTLKDNVEMRGAIQQLFSRFVENFDTNLLQLENVGGNFGKISEETRIFNNQISDDLTDGQVNTLENGFRGNEQHESPKNETMWHRSKQSIPVLESVRHLVNSVRDGHLNNTKHVQGHRTLISEIQPMPENTTSLAIETEEEREMVNASSDLQFFEVLGSVGSKLWGFLSNIRQVFAASASSASASSSSGSS